jgi:hypothetical protein
MRSPSCPCVSTSAAIGSLAARRDSCVSVGYGCARQAAGGSGEGPRYVNGPVYANGSDPYGPDSDGDGVGCEA